LKTIQEIVTLIVFAGFSVVYLKEPLGWNHLVGFALIAAGAGFISFIASEPGLSSPRNRQRGRRQWKRAN
jgi:drug/metabolite transporter (DMT)-like permease